MASPQGDQGDVSKEEEPQAKRLKSSTDDDDDDVSLLQTLVSPELLDQKDKLRQDYAQSGPYPHGYLKNVFQEDFLQKVFQEIKANSQVTFKESDLFRVYQSIDLANLKDDSPEHQQSLPSVLKLRQLLYSDRWRHFIEDVAGLPRSTLSDKVDCACNCHTTGCHLLCHDDVIGTRRVSYILYLTETDWQATEGGALELYDSKPAVSTDDDAAAGAADQRIPDTIPSKTVLPLFNHLAFFAVEPGFSFHAVQEVLGDRPRLSLQGWYHAAKPPENIKNATLQRLKDVQDKDTDGEFVPIGPREEEEATGQGNLLTEEDKKYLSQYMDETYLKEEAAQEIRTLFESESSVQLQNFFQASWIDKLAAAMEAEDTTVEPGSINVIDDAETHYRRGMSDSWNLVGPAHKQRFLDYSCRQPSSSSSSSSPDEDPQTVGEILALLRQKVMESAPFCRFLSHLTSLDMPTGCRGRIRRFRPGLDYTVAHHGLLTEQSVLDATVCFVRNPRVNEKKAAQAVAPVVAAATATTTKGTEEQDAPQETDQNVWESGDVGGFECYIAADDDAENQQAADEYNQDDDTELLSVSASMNTLSLVFRDPGTMRFVKYVGSRAPSSRWDIAMEYQVPDDEEANNGEGEVDDIKMNAREGKKEGDGA